MRAGKGGSAGLRAGRGHLLSPARGASRFKFESDGIPASHSSPPPESGRGPRREGRGAPGGFNEPIRLAAGVAHYVAGFPPLPFPGGFSRRHRPRATNRRRAGEGAESIAHNLLVQVPSDGNVGTCWTFFPFKLKKKKERKENI